MTLTRIEVNVITGERTIIELTADEIAELQNRPPEPTPVPYSVKLWAVRTVLQNTNQFDQIQADIASSSDNALKNFWEYGTDLVRTSTILTSFTKTLNYTDAQIDQLFVDADNIAR